MCKGESTPWKMYVRTYWFVCVFSAYVVMHEGAHACILIGVCPLQEEFGDHPSRSLLPEEMSRPTAVLVEGTLDRWRH